MSEQTNLHDIHISVPTKKDFLKNGIKDNSPKDVTYKDQVPQTVTPHDHNGINSERIKYRHIQNKRDFLRLVIPGTLAATAGNYGVFEIVAVPFVMIAISEIHQVAGTDGSAVGYNIEKLTGTTAPGSGTEILSSDLDLKGTANTEQRGTLIVNRSARTFNRGDRLSHKLSGTPTSVGSVCVIIEIEYLD